MWDQVNTILFKHCSLTFLHSLQSLILGAKRNMVLHSATSSWAHLLNCGKALWKYIFEKFSIHKFCRIKFKNNFTLLVNYLLGQGNRNNQKAKSDNNFHFVTRDFLFDQNGKNSTGGYLLLADIFHSPVFYTFWYSWQVSK